MPHFHSLWATPLFRPLLGPSVHPRRRVLQLTRLAILLTSAIAETAFSFDYLEHSYFTDRACRAAQERLSLTPLDDINLGSRYLALALVCPNRWDQPYCIGDTKTAEANLNRLKRSPRDGGGHSVTFGDFSAMADHLIEFGPVKGLAKAENEGLLWNVLDWISSRPRGARGLFASISGSACATDDGIVPWSALESHLARELTTQAARGGFARLPHQALLPTAYTSLPQGPADPAGILSFKNPQFLDMVLNSAHHFGQDAYSTWLGYHTTAVSLARSPCTQWLKISKGDLKDWARGLPQFKDLDWGEMSPPRQSEVGCQVLSERVRLRLLEWAERAPKTSVAPATKWLKYLQNVTIAPMPIQGPTKSIPVLSVDELESRRLLDLVLSSLAGLVFEGTGLHFLQDGLSGGHIRTIQSKRLSERRVEHDMDNKDGVPALVQTANQNHILIAYGDTYLMGPDPLPEVGACNWESLASAPSSDQERFSDPQASEVDTAKLRRSACLVRHQRGVLVSTSEASLLDWSLDGPIFSAATSCKSAKKNSPLHQVCQALPLTAPRAPGFETRAFLGADSTPPGSERRPATQSEPLTASTSTSVAQEAARLAPGTLPIPPSPYTYESLVFHLSLDPDGRGNQMGLDLGLYSRLGSKANWLTSHRIGLRMLGGTEDRNRFTADYAYGFHFRWAARFLVDAEPFVFFGARNFGTQREFIMGLGPKVGLTVLPEGWTKIPFELSLSYRMPMTLAASRSGFFGKAFEVEAFWIQFGIGLAFL